MKAVLPYPLGQFGHKVLSQNDEDGIIGVISSRLQPPQTCVEIGVVSWEANCLHLVRQGWQHVLMDIRGDGDFIKREHVAPDNVNRLFEKYQIPPIFGVLSIDIDGQDYWVWEAISCEYRPALVVIEYNSILPSERSCSVPMNSNWHWDRTQYYGASLLALNKLANTKGYHLVYANGVNAFFVMDDLLANPEDFTYDDLFRPWPDDQWKRHRDAGVLAREWVDV
jgi:hypothetical protein